MERVHGYALPLRANSDQVADANGDGVAEVGGKGMNNAWDGLYPLPPDDGPRASEKRQLLRIPTWPELIVIALVCAAWFGAGFLVGGTK